MMLMWIPMWASNLLSVIDASARGSCSAFSKRRLSGPWPLCIHDRQVARRGRAIRHPKLLLTAPDLHPSAIGPLVHQLLHPLPRAFAWVVEAACGWIACQLAQTRD